jgi:hypothetical protein
VSGSPDRHANARDRKLAKRKNSDAMRGKRSVFEIQKAIAKRGKAA